jgi:hypothetical protein
MTLFKIKAGKTVNIDKRLFRLNDQWNMIHLPERPNGFGILLIGDVNHYVDQKTSSWIQHPERHQLLQQLQAAGYTIFYSNLYGRHWGSPKAIYLLTRLFQFVIQNEILNPKVHLLAEGMGAYAALNWAENMKGKLRSAAYINPCFDLKKHIEHEKERKFFYKRLLKEISEAYEIDRKEANGLVQEMQELHQYKATVPTKIWHVTQGTPYPVLEHSRPYEQIRESLRSPITLSMHLPGKPLNFFNEIQHFYNQNEVDL